MPTQNDIDALKRIARDVDPEDADKIFSMATELFSADPRVVWRIQDDCMTAADGTASADALSGMAIAMATIAMYCTENKIGAATIVAKAAHAVVLSLVNKKLGTQPEAQS